MGIASEVRRAISEAGDNPDRYNVYDVKEWQPENKQRLQDTFSDSGCAFTDSDLAKMSINPAYVASLLVARGDADVAVGGSMRPTAEVLRAAIRIIGCSAGIETMSSCFLLLREGHPFAFGDCGVIFEPTSEQLADIALATAHTFSQLTGAEPRVAMLSSGTHGSARHASIDRVRAATELVRRRAPELNVDGELQFDAAIDPDVARLKAGSSSVAGRANVFIFPNLDAANIGYKIAQQLGGAAAYGPLLQGLARPIHDVSRGCSAEDIVVVSVLGSLLVHE